MNCGVYFIGSGEFVKIGISADVMGRMEELQRWDPVLLEVLAVEPMPSGRAVRRERELHWRFQLDRVRGEWFRKSPALLAHIAWLAKVVA